MKRIATKNNLLGLCLISITLGIPACAGNPTDAPQDWSRDAERLYDKAQRSMRSANFETAIGNYELLEARYPLSAFTRQAQLDLMHCYYRAGHDEQAVSTADQFIRENPTHPRVDYAYYVKGLVYFERNPGPLERLLRVDLTRRPPSDARLAFSNFATMINQFPDSEYAEDARLRMVFLRNRLAMYEIHVAKYYVKRGAYVAAANRAKFVLENYAGAPSNKDALEVLVESYSRLGVIDLAADAERVLHENYPN